MSYSVLHVVHLLAAIFFIGTLFFEVMILGRIRQQVGEQVMKASTSSHPRGHRFWQPPLAWSWKPSGTPVTAI